MAHWFLLQSPHFPLLEGRVGGGSASAKGVRARPLGSGASKGPNCKPPLTGCPDQPGPGAHCHFALIGWEMKGLQDLKGSKEELTSQEVRLLHPHTTAPSGMYHNTRRPCLNWVAEKLQIWSEKAASVLDVWRIRSPISKYEMQQMWPEFLNLTTIQSFNSEKLLSFWEKKPTVERKFV